MASRRSGLRGPNVLRVPTSLAASDSVRCIRPEIHRQRWWRRSSRPAHPVCLQQSRVPHVAFNMRNAAMGTTADRIARNVAAQARTPVVDLAAHRSARQLFKEAEIDRDGFEQRIAGGLDPCFAVYAHAQAMVSIAAEHLAMMKEARQFARIVGEAEDAYMPSYPPMSPVTTSHFAMWSLFDVQFGQSRETVGTCFLRIAELTEMPAELRTTVAALQATRLGIYMPCGHAGCFVRHPQ